MEPVRPREDGSMTQERLCTCGRPMKYIGLFRQYGKGPLAGKQLHRWHCRPCDRYDREEPT